MGRPGPRDRQSGNSALHGRHQRQSHRCRPFRGWSRERVIRGSCGGWQAFFHPSLEWPVPDRDDRHSLSRRSRRRCCKRGRDSLSAGRDQSGLSWCKIDGWGHQFCLCGGAATAAAREGTGIGNYAQTHHQKTPAGRAGSGLHYRWQVDDLSKPGGTGRRLCGA